jgi:hypothetical protein
LNVSLLINLYNISIRTARSNNFAEGKEQRAERKAKKNRSMLYALCAKILLHFSEKKAILFQLEQMTMGAVQDQIRAELDRTMKSQDVEIKDLKRRVTAP